MKDPKECSGCGLSQLVPHACPGFPMGSGLNPRQHKVALISEPTLEDRKKLRAFFNCSIQEAMKFKKGDLILVGYKYEAQGAFEALGKCVEVVIEDFDPAIHFPGLIV